MARKLRMRIEYPGALYHVMNRGDRREPIFKDDFDHRRFLKGSVLTIDTAGMKRPVLNVDTEDMLG